MPPAAHRRVDPPVARPERAADRLDERALAGAVRTDDRGQRAGGELTTQMMNRRTAVIG